VETGLNSLSTDSQSQVNIYRCDVDATLTDDEGVVGGETSSAGDQED